MISQIDIKKLTQILPIFPLPGAIVLPNGNLPLNIFEPRYISMIESVLGSHRMIGMVQPHKKDSLYPVGCAAKIISFSETSDNRYLIELKGLIRFKIIKELKVTKGFRNIQPDWVTFNKDLYLNFEKVNILSLLNQLKVYFKNNNISVDFSEISKISNEQIIAAIPQICSFTPVEKQAILEAQTEQDILEVLISLLKMNLSGDNENNDQTIN